MSNASEIEAARAMRDFISGVIERYAEGCEANSDAQGGRIAAGVARSIGRLIAEIPPGAVLVPNYSPQAVAAEVSSLGGK